MKAVLMLGPKDGELVDLDHLLSPTSISYFLPYIQVAVMPPVSSFDLKEPDLATIAINVALYEAGKINSEGHREYWFVR